MQWLDIAVVIVGLAGLSGLQLWSIVRAEQRERQAKRATGAAALKESLAEERLAEADEMVQRATEAERAARSRPPEYVRIPTYSDEDAAYLRQISEIYDNPTFKWFLCQARETMIGGFKDAPQNERSTVFGALWYHDYIVKRLHELKGRYDAITNPDSGEEE